MILQVITPEKALFNLPVSLPAHYLGKQVHCLFYIEEEAKNVSISTTITQKPSDFIGIFNKKEATDFEQHILKMRQEWNRAI